MYRASRFCRCLGNPTAYSILRCLSTGRKTPSQLSNNLHVPLPTVSTTLRHLRELDLVRYETKGNSKQYWLKDQAVLNILHSIEAWVDMMRVKQV